MAMVKLDGTNDVVARVADRRVSRHPQNPDAPAHDDDNIKKRPAGYHQITIWKGG